MDMLDLPTEARPPIADMDAKSGEVLLRLSGTLMVAFLDGLFQFGKPVDRPVKD
jgi:hypothetical protein